MKKVFNLLMMLAVVTCMVSCHKTKKENAKEQTTAENVLVVESVTSTDRQDMFLNYAENYKWFETSIVLKDYLDSEESDGTVESVTNVFQIITDIDETSADIRVLLFTHTTDTVAKEVIQGFWVGDDALNDEEIKIKFNDAYEALMATNIPKPHSRQVVLREEVGPKAVNPQYIFGNTKAQVYVDAVTGDVTDKNPAFDE